VENLAAKQFGMRSLRLWRLERRRQQPIARSMPPSTSDQRSANSSLVRTPVQTRTARVPYPAVARGADQPDLIGRERINRGPSRNSADFGLPTVQHVAVDDLVGSSVF
jgi:hypothetical protein